MDYYTTLVKPLMTEKSTVLGDIRNQFFFKVHPDATKPEIKKAIQHLFDVEVLKVNTLTMPGKIKRVLGRPGRTVPWKKAVVTLKEGQTIEMV